MLSILLLENKNKKSIKIKFNRISIINNKIQRIYGQVKSDISISIESFHWLNLLKLPSNQDKDIWWVELKYFQKNVDYGHGMIVQEFFWRGDFCLHFPGWQRHKKSSKSTIKHPKGILYTLRPKGPLKDKY